MSRALLYNPENDIALAFGGERFTPPRVAADLAAAGALLPLWWGEAGDVVLAPRSCMEEAMALKERFGLKAEVAERIPAGVSEAMPWGWSLYARRKFLSAGMAETSLPSPDAVERIRILSHRRTSILIHKALGTPAEILPVEAFTTDEAMEACRRFGRAVVKLPWSCSGRGVMFSRRMKPEELERRIEGSIHRQKSVIIEPEFTDTRECAALFYASPDGVEFRGFSAFFCSESGAYIGNMVQPQHIIESHCGPAASALAVRLTETLPGILSGRYTGWLGVDFLVLPDGSLWPCMELNLRLTMGVAAWHLTNRGLRGVLRICPVHLAPADALNLSPTGSDTGFYLIKEF